MKNRERSLTVYISGLYSGPNPSPGVGTARSLRAAYPDAILIGVDYSSRSSGLHWMDLDDVWLQRPWDELDLAEYAAQVKQVLDAGAFWISGLDLETVWLARTLPEHPHLLIPPAKALGQTVKPAVPSHKGLAVRIPPYASSLLSETDLYEFCRKHGWPIWVKGPWYEARRVENWHDAGTACSQLSETWATDSLFLQAHIVGYEESVAFCAFEGELLDCVCMNKLDITPEGKTWAGRISKVPLDFLVSLRPIVRNLNWTGGAELECIRDVEEILWLLEWNPRFPAWIHGATLAGHNLPVRLVERATGMPSLHTELRSEEFARVVLEIPVRPTYPLPPLPEPVEGQRTPALKHPSGMPTLAKRLRDNLAIAGRANVISTDSTSWQSLGLDSGSLLLRRILKDLSGIDFQKVDTPCWLFLESTARYLFQEVARIGESPNSLARLRIAYSVKTNPDNRLLRLAKDSGFLVEVISQLELEKCISEGFRAERVVLNGPGKWWPGGTLGAHPIYALFCDSVEEMGHVVELLSSGMNLAYVVGIRVRPPQIVSRFGVPVSSFDVFQQLVDLIDDLPSECGFGIHFHIPSSQIGLRAWRALLESVIRWGEAIETSSGKRVEHLDIGGGFFPGDLQKEFPSNVENVIRRAKQILPSLHEIILEPGKALAQPVMGLAVRVLEVRRSHSQVVDAVVDGSIAELPEAWHYPHRVLWLGPDGEWKVLERGRSSRLLGRLCMESDILVADIDLPDDMKQGDILTFCDAGAYDRSMSYAFGRG